VRVLAPVIGLTAAALAFPATTAAGLVGREAAPRLTRLDVPRELRVVSYYPADAGWTRMWEPWRPARLAADLKRLRGLNANTVRVVVSPPFFGYPTPQRRYVRRLHELVAIAAAQGLHVQLTLFDWWGEYRDVAGSKRWARALLAAYVGDPRIAFVELRNEIDPADPVALAWARKLVPWLRELLRGQTPVTLSVSAPDRDPVGELRALVAGLGAAGRPDFFDAHYFTGGGEAAADVFRRLRQAAAPTPLWIGELGYPTSATVSGYAGVPLTRQAQEAAQAHFLRLCFAAARRLGLPEPGVWILDDFAPGAIPVSDVAPREPEYAFGLFRSDGSAKPAAATLRRLFDGRRDNRFNGSFEDAVQAEDRRPLPGAWALTGLQGLEVVRDDAVARTGAASARISSPAGVPGSAVLAVAPVDGAPVRGRRARLTAWLRGEGATGMLRLAIRWFDRNDRLVGGSGARVSMPLARRWTHYSVGARPPATAAFARVAVDASGFGGFVWIDDVGFTWR
jgi:hypothetical protein